MIGNRPISLASVALIAGLLGSMNDLPKVVEAPRVGAFYNAHKAKKRNTLPKVTTGHKKTRRKMASAASKRNR